MSSPTVIRTLFKAREPERVRSALHRWDRDSLLDTLGARLELALHGSDEAAREYVDAYRQLTAGLLREVHAMRPDLVAVGDDGEVALVSANGQRAQAPIGALENAAAEAPFTPWVARYELADAVGLDLTSRMRGLLGHRALTPPAAPEHELLLFDDLDAQRFIRRVRHYLNHPEAEPALLRVKEAFALSKTELGRLFGVRRQAIDQWIAKGVPAERREKLATLEALVELLQRKLKPNRLPGVARRPADAYGGNTMLDLIGEDRHRELLELTRHSFDWATAA
jgi:hypothetical protein